MTYNNVKFPKYVRTAGKITMLTAITGLLVFIFAFAIDVGTKELSKVSAQTATTTLTVLNTPPAFTINAYERTESSTTTPTNSGSLIEWGAVGTDANGADYYLLICSTNASPTPNNSAAPTCGGGIQWGVSTSTDSGTLAYVATTTTEVAPFAQSNIWYGWVCDGDAVDPRCSVSPVQGYSATNSSPFIVNFRPVLTAFDNDGPADPGEVVNFYSTSTDPDTEGGDDDIYLIVCNSNTDYSTTTNTCPNDFIASSTVGFLSDASAAYTLAAIMRDDAYPAYGYIIDEHGHEANSNPIQNDFTVNNVAPTVLGGDIDLNGGIDISLTIPADETTGFTLDFTIRDANSCLTAASSSEIVDYTASVFRSSYGTTTCNGTVGSYDPNYCYASDLATTTWNLVCTPTNTCASPLQDSRDYSCTFPLWFLADPTDAGPNTPATFAFDNWSAGVLGIDDDALAGVMSTTSAAVELISFSSISILANEIAYGGIEPGNDTGTLIATSTLLNVGNTGLDQEARGESMCGTYSLSTPCAPNPNSTIPEDQQQFASTTLSYNSPFALTLSSTTDQEVELDVFKTISTSTPEEGTTYWGIAVPIAITLAGSYEGLNTFTAVTAEATDWF
jgi:hypothetical protein